MGRTGRPPKPRHMHLVDGTFRADRHGSKTDAVTKARERAAGRCPSPPAWLKGKARAEWNRVASKLHARGLLSPEYVAVLADYCDAYADLQKATADHEQSHSAVDFAKKTQASKRMRAAAVEFCMTPVADARRGSTSAPPADPFDEFERERARRREAGDAPVAG